MAESVRKKWNCAYPKMTSWLLLLRTRISIPPFSSNEVVGKCGEFNVIGNRRHGHANVYARAPFDVNLDQTVATENQKINWTSVFQMWARKLNGLTDIDFFSLEFESIWFADERPFVCNDVPDNKSIVCNQLAGIIIINQTGVGRSWTYFKWDLYRNPLARNRNANWIILLAPEDEDEIYWYWSFDES